MDSISPPSPKAITTGPHRPPLQAAVVCREGNCIKGETDFYCLPEEEDCRCPQGPGDL